MKKSRSLLSAFICALVAIALTALSASAQDSEGKALYDASCRKCHGVRGVPPKAMQTKFPKLEAFDAAFVAKHSKDDIAATLEKGKSDDMKSFKDKLTPAQMAAVAAYVHELAASKAP